MKTLNNTEFQELKAFIQSNEIDPRFLNYGGFISEIKPKSYKKEYRETVLPFAGMYKIFTDTNLYTLYPKEGHDLILTEDQKNEIVPIIENRKNTAQYKDAFNTLYNCYGYEYTIYSDDFEEKTSSSNWWISQEPEKLLSLDSSKLDDENLRNEVETEVLKRIEVLKSKNINVLGFEVQKRYGLINFTREEFLYIQKEIITRYKGINENSHPSHQITRRTKKDIKHRISDFKEYVLEPTKRKVLLNVHAYGLTYVEIDKLKNFN